MVNQVEQWLGRAQTASGAFAAATGITDIIKQNMNHVLHECADLAPWPELEVNQEHDIPAVYKTGTASVTLGTTTVNFTGATIGTDWATGDYYHFKKDGYEEIYTISGTTTSQITLDSSYTGTTTTGGFRVFRNEVPLHTSFKAMLSVVQHQTGARLNEIDLAQLREFKPDAQGEGKPKYYATKYDDGRTAYNMVIYPAPDVRMTLFSRQSIYPTDLSAGTDSPFMPDNYRQLLIFGSLWMTGIYLNHERTTTWLQMYEAQKARVLRAFNLNRWRGRRLTARIQQSEHKDGSRYIDYKRTGIPSGYDVRGD